LSVIYIEISCDVENEKGAVLAVIDVELLLFDGIDLFDSECLGLVDEAIIIRVDFFLDCFGL